MILIKAKNPEELYKKAFIAVYNLETLEGDPKNYKDTSAILTLEDYQGDEGVGLNDEGFYSSFDYEKYIVEGKQQMLAEIEHYDQEIIKSGKLASFLKYFKSDETTKKGVINLWENNHLDPKKPFPCLMYAWFRKQEGILHMNCHMRANNAYKILIMDLQIGTSLHAYVAKKMGLRKGVYHHIVDTLHFYEKEMGEIENLYKKLNQT